MRRLIHVNDSLRRAKVDPHQRGPHILTGAPTLSMTATDRWLDAAMSLSNGAVLVAAGGLDQLLAGRMR